MRNQSNASQFMLQQGNNFSNVNSVNSVNSTTQQIGLVNKDGMMVPMLVMPVQGNQGMPVCLLFCGLWCRTLCLCACCSDSRTKPSIWGFRCAHWITGRFMQGFVLGFPGALRVLSSLGVTATKPSSLAKRQGGSFLFLSTFSSCCTL